MFETITAPDTTPIDLADAKVHLALSGDAFDAFVTALIQTATCAAETFLNGCIIDTVRRYYADRFRRCIRIPHGLVKSVASVEYRTEDGEWNTLPNDQWDFVIFDGQCLIFPRGAGFPSVTLYPYNSVRVTFTSGFNDVPESVKHAIRLSTLR